MINERDENNLINIYNNLERNLTNVKIFEIIQDFANSLTEDEKIPILRIRLENFFQFFETYIDI